MKKTKSMTLATAGRRRKTFERQRDRAIAATKCLVVKVDCERDIRRAVEVPPNRTFAVYPIGSWVQRSRTIISRRTHVHSRASHEIELRAVKHGRYESRERCARLDRRDSHQYNSVLGGLHSSITVQ